MKTLLIGRILTLLINLFCLKNLLLPKVPAVFSLTKMRNSDLRGPQRQESVERFGAHNEIRDDPVLNPRKITFSGPALPEKGRQERPSVRGDNTLQIQIVHGLRFLAEANRCEGGFNDTAKSEQTNICRMQSQGCSGPCDGEITRGRNQTAMKLYTTVVKQEHLEKNSYV